MPPRSPHLALPLLVAIAAVITGQAARAEFQDVYTSGHTDINLAFNESTGALSLNFAFASTARINGQLVGPTNQARAASTITVLVGQNTSSTAPAALPAPFGGNPLFILPENARSGVPFVGFSAGDVLEGTFRDDQLTFSLVGLARRPAGGEVVAWSTSNPSSPVWNSADGFSQGDRIDVISGGHNHYNLGFSNAGIYDLVLRGSGILAVGGTSVEVLQTYRFQVVAEPGSLTLSAVGMALVGLASAWRRSRPLPSDEPR